jgi:hypothetical protein
MDERHGSRDEDGSLMRLRRLHVAHQTDSAGDGPLAQAAKQRHGAEVLSSLPLQMALYFNVFYAPCWLAVLIAATRVQEVRGHPGQPGSWLWEAARRLTALLLLLLHLIRPTA